MTDDAPGDGETGRDRERRRDDEERPDGRSDSADRGRRHDRSVPTDRESPVGAPVIRGDESITGRRAREAVQFDPDDPDSLADAAETVRRFADGAAGDEDRLFVLRGAAACAALVRGEGSYKAAAERAATVSSADEGQGGDEGRDGDDERSGTGDVGVPFIRKWARVHDLPRAVRRQVALGNIAPSAAKHVARLEGDERFLLAWAVLDADLTVRDVREVASAVNDGTPVDRALADLGTELGRVELSLPGWLYRDLRRRASLENVEPDDVVADALAAYLG